MWLWDGLSGGQDFSPFNSWSDYQVFEHKDQVPLSLWYDSQVVVERFLPEIENDLYHLRMCILFGDYKSCRRFSSTSPLVKATSSNQIVQIKPHPITETWRKKFKLDYGKLDYVIHQGQPVLIDVNKTIGSSDVFQKSMTSKELATRRRDRAAAIESFF